MTDLALGVLLGLSSGVLSIIARRHLAFAWVALTPLSLSALICPPLVAGVAAAFTAILGGFGAVATAGERMLVLYIAAAHALSWSTAYGAAALALRAMPPVWSLIVLPAAAVMAHLPLRIAGAPRWLVNFLARSQEPCLPVVHIARLGGDLVVTALLALAAACISLLLSGEPRATELLAAACGAALVAAALAYGRLSYRASIRKCASAPRVRMSAVVVDESAAAEDEGGELRPCELPRQGRLATLMRSYAEHVRCAAAAGAEVVLLPEIAAQVNTASRAEWLEAAASWALRERVVIVAPYFDTSSLKNELVIFDIEGCEAGRYEKQHPGPLEPKRQMFMRPGPFVVRTRERLLPLSVVICVDLDYGDLVAPVRAVGGVLLVPAHDWPRFDILHHRTAVWSAVLTGVPLLRSTGHGLSSAYDAAGRVIASQASSDGPVVLVADIPLSAPGE